MHSPESSSSAHLLSYGTLACGATALLSGNAEAATVVNVNATTYNTGLTGIGTVGSSFNPTATLGPKAYLTFSAPGGVSVQQNMTSYSLLSRSTDATAGPSANSSSLLYALNGTGSNSALLNSSDNWVFVKSISNPDEQLWLQLQFGSGSGSGFSVVKAVIPSTPNEVTNAAAAAAVVPETSSLALLSLGAAGLLKRRRRVA